MDFQLHSFSQDACLLAGFGFAAVWIVGFRCRFVALKRFYHQYCRRRIVLCLNSAVSLFCEHLSPQVGVVMTRPRLAVVLASRLLGLWCVVIFVFVRSCVFLCFCVCEFCV